MQLFRGYCWAVITWLDSFGDPAAVDQDVGAGDEAGGVGAEIARQCADVFHLAPAADGNIGEELRIEFRVVASMEVFMSVPNGPGLMPLTVIPSRGEFERQGAREAQKRALAEE